MKKILVVYFSLSGTTANVASLIASLLHGDLFEIIPAKKYQENDLDWKNKESRTTKEHENENCRPEIEGKISNFDQYSSIFIGFPIWWYTAPRIIQTFLDSYNFSGKNVIPFITSLGTTIDKAEVDLRASCKSHPNWLPGKRFGASDSDLLSVKSWIDDLNV